MAWLEQRADTFYLVFRFADQRFKKSLRTDDEREAQRLLTRAERRQRLIEQGDLPVSNDVDLPTYLVSDGRCMKPVRLNERMPRKRLIDQYRESLPDGAMETLPRETVVHPGEQVRHQPTATCCLLWSRSLGFSGKRAIDAALSRSELL